MSSPEQIERAVGAAQQQIRDLTMAYAGLRAKVVTGETWFTYYGSIFEFVNLRFETATSAALLVEHDRVADALGLCRSVLENYLLLKLLCRGFKNFQVMELDKATESHYKKRLRELQQENETARAAGTSTAIEVRAHPRNKRWLLYIFEGLKTEGDADTQIPLHFFTFEQFRAETLRLDEEHYFKYYPTPPDVRKALAKHAREAQFNHQFYLSYSALLLNLELNGMASIAEQRRIEAHYTFLGQFLHPTHDAARQLHEHPNLHEGHTRVGIGQRYAPIARLLALLYVIHLLADICDEVSEMLERAPKQYVREPGTQGLRAATEVARSRFDFFWFIYNGPSPWDRYNWALHHAKDAELTSWGGWANTPEDRVEFSQHIYSQLQSALRSWSNIRLGSYRSPLG